VWAYLVLKKKPMVVSKTHPFMAATAIIAGATNCS
jgi:hypothetical protein